MRFRRAVSFLALAVMAATCALLHPAVVLAKTPPEIDGQADPTDMRLLRMPDIHGNQIVFVYGGNLWTVAATGGEARRLTSAVGFE